jgi:hypothetical protein
MRAPECCPACGETDCLCALFAPDCPACLQPEDECTCDEDFAVRRDDDDLEDEDY